MFSFMEYGVYMELFELDDPRDRRYLLIGVDC